MQYNLIKFNLLSTQKIIFATNNFKNLFLSKKKHCPELIRLKKSFQNFNKTYCIERIKYKSPKNILP